MTVGENITITATLREPGSFTWSYSNGYSPEQTEILPPNVDVDSTDQESTLIITNADESNTGLYTCEVVGSTQSGFDRTEVFVSRKCSA